MQLSRKGNNYPQKPVDEVKPEPLSKSQRAMFETVTNAQVPYGKYKGRTAGYIEEHEQWYWKWMDSEGLLVTWGMIRLKDDAMKPKRNKKKLWDPWYNPDTGMIMMGLREVLEQGTEYVDPE